MSERFRSVLLPALLILCSPLQAAGDPVPLGPLGGQALTVLVDPDDDAVVLTMSVEEDALLRSEDGGRSFAGFGTGLPGGPRSLVQDPSSNDVIYALLGGGLHRSADRGATWSPLGLNAGSDLLSLDFHPGGTAWLANDGSQVYRSMDGGRSWTAVFTGVILGNVTYAPADGSRA